MGAGKPYVAEARRQSPRAGTPLDAVAKGRKLTAMESTSDDMEFEQRHYLRRELYEQIGRTTEFLDFLQLGSVDGIWFRDLQQTDQAWISPQFWLLLGYSPSNKEHRVAEWQNLIFAEDLEVSKVQLQRHLDNSQHPFDQMVRFQHRRGHTIWMRERGFALRDPDTNAPIRMLGTYDDLTKLVGSEEMLSVVRMQVDALKMQMEALGMQLTMANNRIKQLQSELANARDKADS